MTARRATMTAVSAVVGVSLLMILLVTWASSIGPGDVLTGDGPATNRVSAPPTTAPTLVGTHTSDIDRVRGTAQPTDHTFLHLIAWAFEVIVVLALLALLYQIGRWAWQTWQARRRPEPAAAEIDFDVLAAPDAVSSAILDDADEQRLRLAAGIPDNAIVECWQRFESQAASVGMSRKPWETSSEFTLRVLELVSADTSAVAGLAALYREARFSEHRMTEEDRVAALAALDAIHRGLRLPAPGVPR